MSKKKLYANALNLQYLFWAIAAILFLTQAEAQILQKDKPLVIRLDSLKSTNQSKDNAEMDNEKALIMKQKALDYKQNLDTRNALKSFLQCLNYFEKNKNEKEQTLILIELGQLYEDLDIPERAIDYYQRAQIKVASHKINDINKATLKNRLGECLLKINKNKQAEQVFLAGLVDAEGNEKKELLLHLAEVYRKDKNQNKLLEVNFDLLEIEKSNPESNQLALAYNNVGFVYKEMGDFTKAITLFKQAIEIETKNKNSNYKSLISMRINLGSVYNQEKAYTEALVQLKRALLLAEPKNDMDLQSDIQNFIALIYFNIKDYQNAFKVCQEATRLAEKTDNKNVKMRCYKTFALILEKFGDLKEAYFYQNKQMVLKDSIFDEENLINNEKLINRLNVERTEKELKLLLLDAEKSEFELQKLNLESDKKQKDLEILQKEKSLQEFSYRTKSLEKEKELQLSRLASQQLEQESIMQELALQQFQSAISKQELDKKEKGNQILFLEKEKKILEKNKILQNAQLQSQKSREKYLKILAALSGLIIVSVVFGIVQVRNRNLALGKNQIEIQKINKELEVLNEEISHKNKNITDSINYAKEIQTGILPEMEKWQLAFPQSFIYYKPKDIVSGDFYFLAQIKENWVMAFADCTGHGVTGALMSVIGHNLLTSVTEIHNITAPGIILQEVDLGIRKTLKTKEFEGRDGMEMGVITFDFEKKTIAFASSKRPLYGIRDGEFFEIAGTRKTLGMDNHIESVFEEHIIDLQGLTQLYFCTDGYQDQLGGKENRRFLSKTLKNLLGYIHHLPMENQLIKIDETMKNWMGFERQLDDMMVIGIDLSEFINTEQSSFKSHIDNFS